MQKGVHKVILRMRIHVHVTIHVVSNDKNVLHLQYLFHFIISLMVYSYVMQLLHVMWVVNMIFFFIVAGCYGNSPSQLPSL